MLAGAGSAPACPRGALSPGLVSPRAEHHLAFQAMGLQLGHPGKVTSRLGLVPAAFGGGRAGLCCVGRRRARGQPRCSAPGPDPAAVTQCCGQIPADQDLGLGCGWHLRLPCVAAVPAGLGLTPHFLFPRAPRVDQWEKLLPFLLLFETAASVPACRGDCHSAANLARTPSLRSAHTQSWRCCTSIAPSVSVPRIRPFAAVEQPRSQPRLPEGFGFAPFLPGVDCPRHEAAAPLSSAPLERIY